MGDNTMSTKRKMVKDFTKQTVVLYGKTYTVVGLSDTIKGNLQLHGLVQKLVDSTAGMNTKDFTDAERSTKIDEVYTTLKAGNWTQPSTAKVSKGDKKIQAAATKASKNELAVMKKLGLLD